MFLCPGDDDDDEEEEGEEGEEKMPTCGDYIMHFLTLFWKIIFSIIPPAGEKDKRKKERKEERLVRRRVLQSEASAIWKVNFVLVEMHG